MSSLLSRHHLPIATISGYLRGYEKGMPISPEDWAAAESIGTPTATIICNMERVKSVDPEHPEDSYRLLELAVVVGADGDRPIIVVVNFERFELNFLDQYLAARATECKQAGRDFNYVLIECVNQLSMEVVQILEDVGSQCAEGGSRRDKKSDGAGPVDPTIPLLSVLGLGIDPLDALQIVDIGAFCHMVFGGQPDPTITFSGVRENFRPVPRMSGSVDVSVNAQDLSSESSTSYTQEQTKEMKDNLGLLLGLGGVFSTIAEANPARLAQEQQAPPPPPAPPEPPPPVTKASAPAKPGAPPPVKMKMPGREDAQSQQQSSPSLRKIVPPPGIKMPKGGGIKGGQPPAAARDSSNLQAMMPDLFAPMEEEAPPPPAPAEASFPPIPEPVAAPAAEEPAPPKRPMIKEDDDDFTFELPQSLLNRGTEPEPAPQVPPLRAPEPIAEPSPAPSAGEVPSAPYEQPAAPPPPQAPTLRKPVAPPPSIPRPGRAAPPPIPRGGAAKPIEPPIPQPIPEPVIQQKAPEPVIEAKPEPVAEAKPEPIVEAKPAPKEEPKASKPTLEMPKPVVKPPEAKTTSEIAKPTSEFAKPAVKPAEPKATSEIAKPAAKAPEKKTGETKKPVVPPPKFQIPTPPSTGVESLVAKLEQQVTKAASKLVTQVDQIHTTLENELSTLLKLASGKEEKAEAEFADVVSKIEKQLKDLAEESRLKLSDASATGRYTVKQLVDANQEKIDGEQGGSLKKLMSACKDIRETSLKEVRAVETKLKELIDSRRETIGDLIKEICGSLSEISDEQQSKIQSRFERLKSRMSDESSLINSSFEQHLTSLNEDINAACERASEKLLQSKQEFDSALKQAVAICELELSRIAKSLHGTVVAPALREKKLRVKKTVVELEKKFAEESEARNTKHAAALDLSVTEIKSELQRLVSDSLATIDSTGNQEQQSIVEVFDKTKTYIEEAATKASTSYQELESRISESEETSRRLVEDSATEIDPSLEEDRDSVIENLTNLQSSKADKLAEVIDKHCDSLELRGEAEQQKLASKREEHVESVKQTSEKALSGIRDAVQEAFEAIQMIREKHLE